MTDIKDNPPPLTEGEIIAIRRNLPFQYGKAYEDTITFARQIEAAAFERGKAAMQGEIERLKRLLKMREDQITIEQGMKLELKAKLKALEEQHPVAWVQRTEFGVSLAHGGNWPEGSTPIYLAAGAKP